MSDANFPRNKWSPCRKRVPTAEHRWIITTSTLNQKETKSAGEEKETIQRIRIPMKSLLRIYDFSLFFLPSLLTTDTDRKKKPFAAAS